MHSPKMVNTPPRLSVQTQPGPSTPAPPTRRPAGARRRGLAPGLFIANPDNSDGEGSGSGPATGTGSASSPNSILHHSASSASQRSPVRMSPVTAGSSSSGGPAGGGSRIPSGQSIPMSNGSPRSNPLPPIPPVPAPQSSPLPYTATIPSPQPVAPVPVPIPPSSQPNVPPQPPPQPERHLRRAQTTPAPDPPHLPHEHRPSLGSASLQKQPSSPSQVPHSSPSRALPLLPSPPAQSGNSSPQAGRSPSIPSSAPAGPQIQQQQQQQPQPYPPPTPTSIHSLPEYPVPHSSVIGQSGQGPRMASPESVISPAATVDSGRSFGSVDMGNRTRSDSVQNAKVRVQVTTDNESFTTVDITGMQTAEGIKERVFSKLRFRDDEYPNLSLYRTDVDEQPDSVPVPPDALLHLCNTIGDAKATLKFFVMHATVPTSAGASIVPPLADQPSRIITDNLEAPARTPSRHSKDGSMSSASELFDRGTSNSDWSEIAHDELDGYGHGLVRRATTRSARMSNRNIGSSGGSSRSPITESHTPAEFVSPVPSPTQQQPPNSLSRKGNTTPTPVHRNSPPASNVTIRNNAGFNGQARPSGSGGGAGLGLSLDPDMDEQTRALIAQLTLGGIAPNRAGRSAAPGSRPGIDDMDEDTRELIAQLQKQEEEESAARRRQLEADEEFARKEQQSERDVWEMMQEIESRERERRRAQVEQDEQRARELEAEEAALSRQAEEDAARTAWDEEQRDVEQDRSRPNTFAQERRQRAQHWRDQAQVNPSPIRESAFQSDTLPALGNERPNVGYAGRRPSDSHYEASRQHHYPATNPVFDQQPLYTSPPTQFDTHVPTPTAHRPTGYASTPYEEAQHSTERLNDPRLMQVFNHPGQRSLAGAPGRQASRPGLTAIRRESDLTAPALQNARSMDNLRPFSPTVPVSRPPYVGIPPRSAVTPAPGSAGHLYRSPSNEHPQEGRYPEPSRVPPLTIATPGGSGFLTFPSPHLRSSEGTWTGYGPSSSYSPSNMEPPRRPSYDRMPSPRPQSSFDRTPSPPRTGSLPRRPSTLYDEQSPQVVRNQEYPPTYGPWRPRSGSASATLRSQPSPGPDGSRRSSETSVNGQEATLLPYAISPEHPWLGVPRERRDYADRADTASTAGTVSSRADTIRPDRGTGDEEDDSADTARAGDLQVRLSWMMGPGDRDTLRPGSADRFDDSEESTLFIPVPIPTASPDSIGQSQGLRPSPSKPYLYVNTGTDVAPPGLVESATPSDSATESEGESRIHRAKSFRPQKDQPDQWHVRPEPEQLYDDLDNFFPQIDLDKPIVEGGLSTPTTPASESPRTTDIGPPPPLHPTRLPYNAPVSPDEPTLIPTNRDFNKEKDMPEPPKPLPPPQHPARGQIQNAGFNKAENRKSIRLVADYKRRTMKHDDKKDNTNITKVKEAEEKPKRRFSMWGHKIQEVTSTKLASGQLSNAIPESPLADGKPATLNWVKGELIGKGSYGRVYIAMNVTTGDMMAVKQVELPNTERDRYDRRQTGMIDALKSEIALLKDLYHPNIVAYLGCETSPEYLSIFLEYVPGGTIASIYRTPNQARFEEPLVKFFTKQILEGLAYLHGRHIWHRDLKGDNILVDAAGVCKISDFGISKQTNDAYDSYGQATTMKGSVFWMAPEVIHSPNDRTYSGKVDIWSLGCVVLEMWTGSRPWGSMEQVSAMFELFNKRARPPLPPDIRLSPTALDFMNEKCLAKDPDDRPMARELLQHPFITESDPNWTFARSKIGKAVAKKAPKTMRHIK